MLLSKYDGELKKIYLRMDMIQLVKDRLDGIIALCRQHHVAAVSLFGSAAKGAMVESSDIDLLVQFSDEIDVLDYADNYFSLKEKLESLIGRKVDLVSRKSLKNPVLIEEILGSKIDLYAA